jgi:hypothetical protein
LRFTVRSRSSVEGDLISTARSGAPWMLARVMICSRSLDTKSRSGWTTLVSDRTTSAGAA